MSKLLEFREIERMLHLKKERLEKLKSSPALQQELAFKDKFQALLQQYDKTLGDVVSLLDPRLSAATKSPGGRRKG